MKNKSNTMKFLPKQNAAIYALFLISIIGLFSGCNEPIISILKGTVFESILYKFHTGNSIILNMSSGYFGGFITWLLLVEIPSTKKKAMLKRQLARSYQELKASFIDVILFVTQRGVSSDVRDALLDPTAFKEYFKHHDWYDFPNGLQNNKHYLADIIFAMKYFEQETSYTLNAYDFRNEKSFIEFKQLSNSLARLSEPKLWGDDYEYIKRLSGEIWGILARFNFSDGYTVFDPLEQKIHEIH